LEQSREAHAQPLGDADDNLQRGIRLPALERSDVRPMDTDRVREALLRIPRALAQGSHGSAEDDVDGGHAFTVQH
jgi:hypothetical protein